MQPAIIVLILILVGLAVFLITRRPRFPILLAPNWA